MITKQSLEDILVWPDDTWCYREELEEMLTFMSDDFRTISVNDPEYDQFLSLYDF